LPEPDAAPVAPGRGGSLSAPGPDEADGLVGLGLPVGGGPPVGPAAGSWAVGVFVMGGPSAPVAGGWGGSLGVSS